MQHDDIFIYQNIETRWVNFENPNGIKGGGGEENGGAKGHAFESLEADEKKQLLLTDGSGIIRRIWITIDDRSRAALQKIFISMYWDDEETPSVLAPLGDFFCLGAGEMAAFENEFFSSPEARSFNCIIPMPYKRNAKIFIENKSGKCVDKLFYEIAYTVQPVQSEAMYFHTDYNRLPIPTDSVDSQSNFPLFEILPNVKGKGRFLGCTVSLVVNEALKSDWWGEGEVKIFLDGDTKLPTLVGTGTEDYIGSAWGQDTFSNRYQGCTCCEKGRASFYRFHMPDPIYFNSECRVTIQQLGGCNRIRMREHLDLGVKLRVISADYKGEFTKLFDTATDIDSFGEDCYFCYYRHDDYRAAAYYYLDRP